MPSTRNLRQRRSSKKLADRWIGPYQLVRVMDSKLVYQLRLPPTMRQHDVSPISPLEPYHGDDPASKNRRDDVDTSDVAYEVERILAHRGPPQAREFLIRWKGYPPDDDSWEPLENLDDGPMLREYLSTMMQE